MAFADLFSFGQQQQPVGASPAWGSVDGVQYQNGAPGIGTSLDGTNLVPGAQAGMSPQQRMALGMMLSQMVPKGVAMPTPFAPVHSNVAPGGVQGAI